MVHCTFLQTTALYNRLHYLLEDVLDGHNDGVLSGHDTGGSWTPATGLSCIDCPDPIANPGVTTTYYLTINDGFRCVELTDSVVVNVITTDSSYIAFSAAQSPCKF